MIDDSELTQFRARQRGRNRVMALILGALVILFFAISIVKITGQAKHRPEVPVRPIKQS